MRCNRFKKITNFAYLYNETKIVSKLSTNTHINTIRYTINFVVKMLYMIRTNDEY